MTWADLTLYGFDLETTGVDVFTDRIITGTVVKVRAGEVLDKRTWLLNPGIDIPEGATKVHGITTEHAREHGQDPALGIADIADVVTGVLRAGYPLIAFNAAYDLSLLEAECRRHNLPGLNTVSLEQVIDPFVLGKGYEHNIMRKYVKGRTFKLPDMCERYKVPFVETHDATADATGAVLLACALASEEPYFTSCNPAALHQLQVTWRREDMASLRKYFDKRGTEHDGCDGGWPLHTRLQAVSV
jgi:DNA polymerase-3 subunit epsilon